MVVGVIWFLGSLPVIYFFKYGVLDEFDFWAGTIGLVVFSMIEVILFAWIFGMDRGWKELHRGADIRVPRPFYYIMKYVTPVLLLVLFSWWFYDAIKENKLIPTPKVSSAVMDRHEFPGDFERAKPSEDANTVIEFFESDASGLHKKLEQLTDADFDSSAARFQELHADWDPERWKQVLPEVKKAAELQRIESQLSKAVSSARRDLIAWVKLELNDGQVTVKEVQGDPDMLETLTLEKAQRWLSLQEFRYEKKTADEPEAAKELTLAVQGLHRAPYIWLGRIMMVAFTVVFLVSIAVIWKSRRKGPQTDESPEEGAAK
jgi:hypothetical protein